MRKLTHIRNIGLFAIVALVAAVALVALLDLGASTPAYGQSATTTATTTPTSSATSTPEATPTSTAVPRPTSTPAPVPTSVPITRVEASDVQPVSDPVEGGEVAIIQPDESTTVSNENVSISFPKTSRATTYQVAVQSDPSGEFCVSALTPEEGEAPKRRRVGQCVNIDIYDHKGDLEENARLIRPASVSFTLSPETAEELGGLAVLLQTQALGGLVLQKQSSDDGPWVDLKYELSESDDGGVVLTTSIRSFSKFAMVLDDDLLQLASNQVAGITPTAIPTATPIPPTATPQPTATPVPPTATPTPVVDEQPEVGDASASSGLLLMLGLVGALLIAGGIGIFRARREEA